MAGIALPWRPLAALAALTMAGCDAPVCAPPEEAAPCGKSLAAAGIAAHEEGGVVYVPREDVPRARALLAAPPAPAAGDGLLASLERTREEARARQAASLRALLLALPGVDEAAVELPIAPTPLAPRPVGPRAVVTVTADAALSDDALLAPLRAALDGPETAISLTRRPPLPRPTYARVGPFAVAPADARPLRALVLSLAAAVVALVVTLLVWYLRAARGRRGDDPGGESPQ